MSRKLNTASLIVVFFCLVALWVLGYIGWNEAAKWQVKAESIQPIIIPVTLPAVTVTVTASFTVTEAPSA